MMLMNLLELMTEKEKLNTDVIISNEVRTFFIFAKEEGIISGLDSVKALFDYFDVDIDVRFHKQNGDSFRRGDILCSVIGKSQKVYKVLDKAVRLLSRSSGISTITDMYQKQLGNTSILDLGQYTPLYEELEQAAIKAGGGTILPDILLIDEIQIETIGSIEDAVSKASYMYPNHQIAIEITDISLFYQAIKTKATILILKHFNDEALRRAKLDTDQEKVLVIGGLITPARLLTLEKLKFEYLTTTFLISASRHLEFGVKLGN